MLIKYFKCQKLVTIYALFLGVNLVGQKLSVLKIVILQLWQYPVPSPPQMPYARLYSHFQRLQMVYILYIIQGNPSTPLKCPLEALRWN